MEKHKGTKNCLIISYGPVPTPQYQTVEGGGMRVWGLATGLKENGVNTTIAVNSSFPQEASEIDGIKIVNWSLDNDFARLINSFDTVLVSYNAGDLSVFVAEHINDNVQLILDAYVPIYIEVSARKAQDMDVEYVNYAADVERHNFTLRRGDYFLSANAAQDTLYTGVLSALRIINPFSYHTKRIIRTPFGIHYSKPTITENPYASLGIKDGDFVVLWFGGIYPWFRIEEYLDSIKQLSTDKNIKFVFVGGKNPFNPNPDLAKQYNTAVSFAKQHKLLNNQVYFVDWVDYDIRANWYKRADIVVSINQPGEENKFSWRTRVMDFVWGDVVTLTNGGDPLSEELLDGGAAIRLDDLSSDSITAAIQTIRKNPNAVVKARKALQNIKPHYYWHNSTKEIAQIVLDHELPYSNESKLRDQLPQEANVGTTGTTLPDSRVKKLIKLPLKVARYALKKGIRRTASVAISTTKERLKTRATGVTSREPQFVFISHPINNTGAPIVLLQIITEYVEKYGSKRVRVIAPQVEKEQKAYLKSLGISVEHAIFNIGFRPIRLQLGLKKNDFVFINTVAIYDNYRDFIMLWLKLGRLKHAHWFIHEDIAQLPVIHKEFLHKGNLGQIKQLVESHKLSLYFPSKRTASEYEDLLNVKGLKPITLRVEIDKKYQQPRKLDDFKSINFLLSGTASDGRKGQLIALAAFQHFLDNYYHRSQNSYRDFKLHLLAVGQNDYISQQIRWIGESTLGSRVKIYEPMPKSNAMKITAACNAVVCCSINETFGLYITEGMLAGHIVLRNNSAGVDEQLTDGENGYAIDHTDIVHFANQIEKILNKKNTNKRLLAMSRHSQKIAAKYANSSYITQIER